jgi:cytoskeleton protein RodZ
MDTNIGAQLRSSREALGLSLASLAQRTRVQPRIISAIEQNDLASIPPKPYGRGFIRAYAREVGLDPDLTVRDYFAQFGPAVVEEVQLHHQPEPWPARQTWLVPAAGMIAVVLVSLAVFRGDASDATDRSVAAPVGTSGGQAVDAPRPDATMGTAPTPEKREAGIDLVVVADRNCWVTAAADGNRVLYQLLQPGAQHTIRADREITLRAGDAGAIRLTVNGRDTGAFGASGQVRTARISQDTAASFGTGR